MSYIGQGFTAIDVVVLRVRDITDNVENWSEIIFENWPEAELTVTDSAGAELRWQCHRHSLFVIKVHCLYAGVDITNAPPLSFYAYA